MRHRRPDRSGHSRAWAAAPGSYAEQVAVREAVPVARVIYIEPDIYVAGSNTKTDAIIIPGHD